MLNTAFGNARPQLRWTHRMALKRTHALPRGMLLARARDRDSVVTRVIDNARLDATMLGHFARMLAITARDWVRK